MKQRRVLRKLAIAVGAGVATLLLSQLSISANPAAGMTEIASTSWLACPRPLAPPHGLPASLKGWGSSENKNITHQISLDQRALARKGIRLTQWGPDPCSGKVKIYLTHYSRASARILITAYGSDVIVSHHSMPRPPIADRSNDTSPFNGGDFLTFITLGVCTGGPVVELNGSAPRDIGASQVLTAGHCDTSLGDLVFRSNKNGDQGPAFGVISRSRLCNNCIDSAIIRHDSLGTRYNYSVWGGPPDSPSGTIYGEDGTAFPQPFDQVTQDSAFTGELSGLIVEDVNQSVTFSDGITRIDLTLVHGGETIIHGGDSGGPWWQHEDGSSRVKIVGTTVGGSGEFAYYEQISRILSAWGAYVPTI
jgi:hypothetical protein